MREQIEELTDENQQRKKFNIEDRKKIEFLEVELRRVKIENESL